MVAKRWPILGTIAGGRKDSGPLKTAFQVRNAQISDALVLRHRRTARACGVYRRVNSDTYPGEAGASRRIEAHGAQTALMGRYASRGLGGRSN